jgi:hypothetical protein
MIDIRQSKQVYDPREMTWDYWCALMSELFASQQLGTVPEERWRALADGMAGTGRFDGAPDSRNFSTWQDWAVSLNNALRR